MEQSYLIRRALSAVVWLIRGDTGNGLGAVDRVKPICTMLQLIYSFNAFSTCCWCTKAVSAEIKLSTYTHTYTAKQTNRQISKNIETDGQADRQWQQAEANSFVGFRAQNQQPLHTLRRKQNQGTRGSHSQSHSHCHNRSCSCSRSRSRS